MSLRARVAIAAMLSTILVVVAAGLGLLVLVRQEERDRLDAELERQSQIVTRPATLAVALRDRRFVRPAPLRGQRQDLLVLARVIVGENVLFASDDFPELPGEAESDGLSTQQVEGESWRVLTTALPRQRSGQEPVVVQVTASMAGVDETTAGLRRLVLIVGAIAVVGAGGSGWLLGSAAIRPLSRLRREAERVSDTADLRLRVPTDQGPREVDELSASLNSMLGRIEEASGQTEAALAASREFAANVAHELRTPLTSMRTNLDVLAANPELPASERAQIVRDIAQQQQRLQDALEALRLLARGELAAEDLFQEVELADLLDGVVAQSRGRHPEVAISFEAHADPLLERAWPEGVRVLADNLIGNAVIHGRANDRAAEVSVILDADDDEWWLAVADNGPGIPAEERERVVERFARGSAASGASGSGLGLALVAQQAALHGGRLEIGEREGGGALVRVRMPRSRGL